MRFNDYVGEATTVLKKGEPPNKVETGDQFITPHGRLYIEDIAVDGILYGKMKIFIKAKLKGSDGRNKMLYLTVDEFKEMFTE